MEAILDQLQRTPVAFTDRQDQKSSAVKRVEFATKTLITRIQNTQNFFLCASNENPHISVEDLWLATIADVIANSKPITAHNDEFLGQLKRAEQQLGLSAQKIKRALCQSQLLNIAMMFAGVAISAIAFISIAYMAFAVGITTALSLIFVSGLIVLAALGGLMTYKARQLNALEKLNMKAIDKQTKEFLQGKHRALNEAEMFIIRRVQAVLPNIALR